MQVNFIFFQEIPFIRGAGGEDKLFIGGPLNVLHGACVGRVGLALVHMPTIRVMRVPNVDSTVIVTSS